LLLNVSVFLRERETLREKAMWSTLHRFYLNVSKAIIITGNHLAACLKREGVGGVGARKLQRRVAETLALYSLKMT
jgi:hypothetical protein